MDIGTSNINRRFPCSNLIHQQEETRYASLWILMIISAALGPSHEEEVWLEECGGCVAPLASPPTVGNTSQGTALRVCGVREKGLSCLHPGSHLLLPKEHKMHLRRPTRERATAPTSALPPRVRLQLWAMAHRNSCLTVLLLAGAHISIQHRQKHRSVEKQQDTGEAFLPREDRLAVVLSNSCAPYLLDALC